MHTYTHLHIKAYIHTWTLLAQYKFYGCVIFLHVLLAFHFLTVRCFTTSCCRAAKLRAISLPFMLMCHLIVDKRQKLLNDRRPPPHSKYRIGIYVPHGLYINVLFVCTYIGTEFVDTKIKVRT